MNVWKYECMYVCMYVQNERVCHTISGLKCCIRRTPPHLLEAPKTCGGVYFMWSGEIFLRNFLPYPPQNIPGLKGGGCPKSNWSWCCNQVARYRFRSKFPKNNSAQYVQVGCAWHHLSKPPFLFATACLAWHRSWGGVQSREQVWALWSLGCWWFREETKSESRFRLIWLFTPMGVSVARNSSGI